MGRKRAPKRMPTLEEQLDAVGGYPIAAGPYDADLDGTLQRRVTWYDQRRDLQARIKARDAKRNRLEDPGRDAGGKFSPSPFAARAGRIETAPKDLGKELQKDGQYPKRVVVQRSIDRLLASGTITKSEWHGAATLLWYWALAEGSTRMVAAYEPDMVRGSATPDAGAIKRMDAASEYLTAMRGVPYRARGIVTWIVINDGELSDWGLARGFSSRHSRRLGAKRLSQGLRALAARWGY